MTKNSARIYIIDRRTEYTKEAIEQALGIKVYTGDPSELDAIRKAAIEFHYRLNKKEPTEQQLQLYLKILTEQRKERIALRKVGRFTRITHSQFCLENAASLTKKLSTNIDDVPIISLVDFDQSVFQMCIYQNGELKTTHQIGEELADMGLSEQHADVTEMVKALDSEEQVIKTIIDNDDICDVEDGIIALIEEKNNMEICCMPTTRTTE